MSATTRTVIRLEGYARAWMCRARMAKAEHDSDAARACVQCARELVKELVTLQRLEG